MGGQTQQRPQDVADLIHNIKNALSQVNLAELGERKHEEKLANLLQQAQEIGKRCAEEGLGKTQMMNVMGRVQGLGSTPTMADIRLLQAHLAYQVAKESSLEILVKALDPWFAKINEEWQRVKNKREGEREEWARKVFDNFVDFVESIVAFHRFQEEKLKRNREQRMREGGAQ
jgi:CRISPR type III-A-associated protein Csm2